MKGESRGFTIIEVVLFLAISGALFVIAFRYTSATVRTTQFTDVTKSLESFIERQYARAQTGAVLSGVTLDPTSKIICKSDTSYTLSSTVVAGTQNNGFSDTCIVLGVFLYIWPSLDKITAYPVLGYAGIDPTAGRDEQVLTLSRAVPWGQKQIDSYELPAGYKIATTMMVWKGSANGKDTWSYNKLAFLKSPGSGIMRTYMYDDGIWGINWDPNAAIGSTNSKTHLGESINGEAFFSGTETSVANQRNSRAILCVQSDGISNQRGVIEFKGNGGIDSFSIDSITSTIQPQSTIYAPGYLSTAGYEGLQCN